MNPVKICVCVFSLLLGAGVNSTQWLQDTSDEWIHIRTRLLYPSSFANVRVNVHGERELRISHEKVLVLETFLPSGYSPKFDMAFRQVTDGRRILQAVFQGDILKECDFTSDSNILLDFVSNFVTLAPESSDFGDVFSAASLTNITATNASLAYMSFNSLLQLKELADLTDIRSLRRKCRRFLKLASATAKKEAKYGKFTDIYDEVLQIIDPETLKNNDTLDTQLDESENSETVNGSSYSETFSREHNIKRRSTAPLELKHRSKRGTFDMSSVLIFPGTKWCGKGDLASCYDDLGPDMELDMCCRDHDCCPYVIPPFTSRFNLFNYRFHSLLHCDCDQRFRGCLRSSVSTMASIIGKIYFNILGSKCFRLMEAKVCMERSWWGRCQRYENQTTAAVVNQVSFLEDDRRAEADSHNSST
ncbi:PA2G3-like protein [Mya arenaria]|uniref:PA2G3-like protein n=1 Tax=Mya arenaria TaxID=6604 RepID=A0ABY7DY01_MYAAR|nr:uncharacterized protein LOC128230106 [Mya arenaria]XP_052798081.1 uncharacterized protein LOC128230106 [Mya arenaria]WAR01508.1 PA2G3-like protein [Mya arenaria]